MLLQLIAKTGFVSVEFSGGAFLAAIRTQFLWRIKKHLTGKNLLVDPFELKVKQIDAFIGGHNALRLVRAALFAGKQRRILDSRNKLLVRFGGRQVINESWHVLNGVVLRDDP